MTDDDEVINPEMVIVHFVPDEPALARRCPNCHRRFTAGDQVFVSLREEVIIHVSCVVGLALVASVRNAGVSSVADDPYGTSAGCLPAPADG
jgi:hypothetical protein